MDRLYAIKIKRDDGSYGDEIPINVLAENVDWDASHTLVDVLGEVDISTSIQDQIINLVNTKATQASVNSLQTRFNNIIAAATQDTEVIDARVGSNGTIYNILKNRLDNENINLKNQLSVTESFVNTGNFEFDVSMFESGSWSYTTKSANTKRIRLMNMIPVKQGMQIYYTNPTLDVYFGVPKTENSGSTGFVTSGWKTKGKVNAIYTVPQDGYLTIICRKDDVVDMAVSDYNCTITIVSNLNTITRDDLVRFNVYDMCRDWFNHVTGSTSHNGITYNWSGNICIASGLATSTSVRLLYNESLPSYLVPGQIYFARCKTTNDNVYLRYLFYDAGSNIVQQNSVKVDTAIKIPSNAVRLNLSIVTKSGTDLTVTPAVVSDMALLNARPNSDIEPGKPLVTFFTDDVTFDPFIDMTEFCVYSGLSKKFKDAIDIQDITWHDNVTYQLIRIYSILYLVCPSYSQFYVGIRRISDGAQFWMSVNGTTYNNTYETNHYENTYNITCSPTITTDTNNYLASTNDNTDRTGDIQTMLNTTGVCKLGPGNFVVTGIEIPAYGLLTGCGNKTTLTLNESVTNGYTVKLKSYSTVMHLRIRGGSTNYKDQSEIGTRNGIIWEGTKISGQSDGTTQYRGRIINCTIENFSGSGVLCSGTGLTMSTHMLISDCEIAGCSAGLNIAYYSEFHRISNCVIQECYYGCIDNGGNNNFANCDFSANRIGVMIDNTGNKSPNNSHGSFANCTINHSAGADGTANAGIAIKLLNAGNGEIFTGMQIHFGSIIIDASTAIRFANCQFGRAIAMTITNSKTITFSGCSMYSEVEDTVTQSGNTTLKFTECYTYNGDVFNPMV